MTDNRACPNCGQFMSVQGETSKAVTYRCKRCEGKTVDLKS